MAMTFVVVAAYLIGVELVYRIRTVGGPVYAFVVFTLAMASLFFYVAAGPLLPALNSYWRQIHVTSMITSTSLLGIGCVLTILYLLRDWSERRGAARLQAQGPPPIMGGSVDAELPTRASCPPTTAGEAPGGASAPRPAAGFRRPRRSTGSPTASSRSASRSGRSG